MLLFLPFSFVANLFSLFFFVISSFFLRVLLPIHFFFVCRILPSWCIAWIARAEPTWSTELRLILALLCCVYVSSSFQVHFFACVFVSRMVGDNSFKETTGHIECAHNRRWISYFFFFKAFSIVSVWSDEFIELLLLLFPNVVSYSVVQIYCVRKAWFLCPTSHMRFLFPAAACVCSTDWLSNRTPSSVCAFPCALWGEAKWSPRRFHSIRYFPPRFTT